MIFLLHPNAGAPDITLIDDQFKHVIKARRHQVGDVLHLRHITKAESFFYTLTQYSKKEAHLALSHSTPMPPQTLPKLHLGWCMIDPKSIEKVLPSLCELGVHEISFLIAKRTQRDFTMDLPRLERIMYFSMQQCGRFTPMRFNLNIPLESFLKSHPTALVLDFCDTVLESQTDYTTVILGPEGGFSSDEKELLANFTVRKLPTPLVLRSETAALAIAARFY